MFVPLIFAEHTIESLYLEQGRDRPWVYRILLVGTLAALASLPLVRVDVAVRAPGMVRPETERTELTAPLSARIEQVLVRDNDLVAAGQPLLVLASADVAERLARNRARQREAQALVADLQLLTGALAEGREVVPGDLHVPALRQEQAHYLAQRATARLAEARARQEGARIAALAARGIATQQELDNARYEVARLAAEERLLTEQALLRWHTQCRQEQETLAELVSTGQRWQEEERQTVVRAPAAGLVLGFSGWQAGGYVGVGQALGAISPEAALTVETYVASRDVGLIAKGQPVRLQVDAFPPAVWGTLDGSVTAVSGDWVPGGAGREPVFKVTIRPHATHLLAARGQRAELRKGLTLSARFLVAERSLLQLLHDDASAWFNPHDTRPL